MKTATFVKKLDGFNGDAVLYKVDPPMKSNDGNEAFQYVVASAVVAMFTGPETYLFGADADGEIRDWDELPGSFRGALDHERAVRDAGYYIA